MSKNMVKEWSTTDKLNSISIIVLVTKNYGCLNSSCEERDKVVHALLVCLTS